MNGLGCRYSLGHPDGGVALARTRILAKCWGSENLIAGRLWNKVPQGPLRNRYFPMGQDLCGAKCPRDPYFPDPYFRRGWDHCCARF